MAICVRQVGMPQHGWAGVGRKVAYGGEERIEGLVGEGDIVDVNVGRLLT